MHAGYPAKWHLFRASCRGFGHPGHKTRHAGQWRCKYPDAVELEQASRVEEPGSIEPAAGSINREKSVTSGSCLYRHNRDILDQGHGVIELSLCAISHKNPLNYRYWQTITFMSQG